MQLTGQAPHLKQLSDLQSLEPKHDPPMAYSILELNYKAHPEPAYQWSLNHQTRD